MAKGDIFVNPVANNLVLVDPNSLEDENGNQQERLVDHENLIIYANLKARLVPRSKLVVGGSAEVVVDLFDGAVDFLNPQNKTHFDSDWTDVFTDSSINKQTQVPTENFQQTGEYTKKIENTLDFQGFGMNNIHIKFGADFTPMVSINFTDIRGETLFSQGDVNTPYTAFFHLPYPQFELTLKGYYGKAVQYRLALLKFNARFEPASGDYSIQCDFIGNHIAVLRDITMQECMVAPYMYPIVDVEGNNLTVEQQQQIFKESAEGDTSYMESVDTSSGIGRQVMNSVYKRYKDKLLIPKNMPQLTIWELIEKIKNFEKDLSENFSKVDLRFLDDKKKYSDTLNLFYQSIFGAKGWKDTYLDNTLQKTWSVEGTGTGDTKVALARRINVDSDEYITIAEERLKKRFEGFVTSLGDNFTFGIKGIASIDVQDRFTVEKQRADQYTDKIAEQGWYVLDTQPKTFLFEWKKLQKEFEDKFNVLQEETTEKLNTVFIQTLGFKPTIRNLMSVIVAGADTYLLLLDKVHREAYEKRTEPKRLDAVKGTIDLKAGEESVYPWPEYYLEKEVDGQTKYELTYLGATSNLSSTNAQDPVLWPEVYFVEEYARTINFRVNELNVPYSNESEILNYIPLSVREFPFTNTPYGNEISTANVNLWELVDRANDLSYNLAYSYLNTLSPHSRIDDATLELAKYEAKNFSMALALDSELQQFFKEGTGKTYTDIIEKLKTDTENKWVNFILGGINTGTINDRPIIGNNIIGTNFGIFPENLLFVSTAKDAPFAKVLQIPISDKQDGVFSTLPFNFTSNQIWLKDNMANGKALSNPTLHDISKLTVGPDSKCYATLNPKYFFSNLNWDTNSQSTISLIGENEELQGVLPNVNPDNVQQWSTNVYQPKIEDILHQQLLDGIDVEEETVVSMMNTPYFANSLVVAAGTDSYELPLYLFLNSLPLSSPLEKIIETFKNKNQYGGYMCSLIRELASHHTLPLALVLKIGSIWWRHSQNIETSTDPLSDIWNDVGFIPSQGATATGPAYVYTDQVTGLAYDYQNYPAGTSNFIIADAPNLRVEVGVYPRLVQAVHKIVTGKEILTTPGNISSQDFLTNFIVPPTFTPETHLTFSGNNIDVKFWSSWMDSDDVGALGLSQTNQETPSNYYILYPSTGGLIQSDIQSQTTSFLGNNNLHNGNVRCLWAGTGYGYFETNNSLPPTLHYHKKIDNSKDEQDAWQLLSDGTQYTSAEGLMSVFPTQVLNAFMEVFENFASSSNPDTNIINGQYKSFKEILQKLFYVSKTDISSTPDEPLTKKLAQAQYKNFNNYISTFLNQNVLYKQGSATGLDIVSTYNGGDISTLQLMKSLVLGKTTGEEVDIEGITVKNDNRPGPYGNNLPPDVTLAAFSTTSLYQEFQHWIGSVSLDSLDSINSFAYQFFQSQDIEATPATVQAFAPLIKQFRLFMINGGTGSSYLGHITSIIEKFENKNVTQFVNQVIKDLKKVDAADVILENTRTDSRPDIVADNLKLELYQVFKTMNDKWVSGDSDTLPPTKTLFEQFLFLDRTNADIGDEAIIDIFLFQQLDNPFNGNHPVGSSQTLADFISYILSKNFFNFLPLPSYVNFYGVGKDGGGAKNQGNTMFGTFLEVDYQDSAPTFLCQYIGPPSTKLNIKTETNRFPNDSFNIGSVANNPLATRPLPQAGTEHKSNNVMAFAVDFGVPNQNIFESVTLDQSEFKDTSEGFRVIEDMGKQASGRDISTNSINLFNLYKTRSYTCNVSCMGNMLIQPTTYFQLRYLPMFNGPYLIIKVEHTVTPNELKTTFTGIRIPIPSLPKVTDLIMKIQENLLSKISEEIEIDPVEQVNLDPFDLTEEEKSLVEGENGYYNDNVTLSNVTFDFQPPTDMTKVDTPSPTSDDSQEGNTNRIHKGLDLTPKTEFQNEDIEITSSFTGVITELVRGCVVGNTSCGDGYGNHLMVARQLVKLQDGNYLTEGTVHQYLAIYANLREIEPQWQVNDTVEKGAVLGKLGNTGSSTAPHLHYEVKRMVVNNSKQPVVEILNPLKLIQEE